MVPTFLGITLLTFALARWAPGDPLSVGSEAPLGTATQEQVDAYRRAHGLDRPILEQYVRWLARVVALDFGVSSQDGREVRARIAEALPRTLLLALLALLLAYLVAVPLGVWSAVRPRSWLDRITTVATFALYSLPSFWVAVMLLLAFAGGRVVELFPMQGLASDGADRLGTAARVADVAWHLVLPVACLSYGALAAISRYARSGLLDVVRQDFVRTARAKGLPERVVIFRHALRNSLLPLVTLVGVMLPQLLGGSVIVERIFGIPGMGLLAFEAVSQRDYPTVMGVTTLAALFTLVSVLATDLAYARLDPRIRLGGVSQEGG